MANLSFRNRPVQNNRFALNPRTRIQRSVFTNTWSHKTTFDAGYLIPHYVDEVLPGDSHHVSVTLLARMQTPVVPILDDLWIDTFYFYVPARLCWLHWPNFMGERSPNIDSSIDYVMPQATQEGGDSANLLPQYFGIPMQNIDGTGAVSVNALPLRAFALIYNEWFRRQDLINKIYCPVDDGPDVLSNYSIPRRSKQPDYFTKALPWPQKGSTPSSIVGTGDVRGIAVNPAAAWTVPPSPLHESGNADVTYANALLATTANALYVEQDPAHALYPNVTAEFQIPINVLREAEAVQVLLERDARGGTRYTEILEEHFDVRSPDARLQRPEYLGGSSQRMGITTIPQTSETGATPLGNLGAAAVGVDQHSFSGSFVEHGYVIGLVNVRQVQTYQQGLHPLWSRRTRYDWPWPEFGHLGEQAVLTKEIWYNGHEGNDNQVFGYQPRYEEMRFHKSLISGQFRSGIAATMDMWHLAAEFSINPTLSQTFIEEKPPMERILAAGEALEPQSQILADFVYSGRFVRPLPANGTPMLGGTF